MYVRTKRSKTRAVDSDSTVAAAVTDRQTAVLAGGQYTEPFATGRDWQRHRKREKKTGRGEASGGGKLARQFETATDGRLHEFAVLRRCFAGGRREEKGDEANGCDLMRL